MITMSRDRSATETQSPWDIHYNTDPRAIASIYMTVNLGDQLVLENVIKETKTEIGFRIDACVPSKVLKKHPSQSFLYRFPNMGEIMVNLVDYKVSATSAMTIDDKIRMEFNLLFKDVEKIVREHGNRSWGRMSLCQTFLNPFYEITIQILNLDQPLKTSDFIGREQWLTPLFQEDYAEITEELYIEPTNTLIGLQEELQAKMGEEYHDFELAQLIVGTLIAKHHDYIRTNLNTQPFQPYIDMTKSYYLAALEADELIPLPSSGIFQKFTTLGRTYRTYGVRQKMKYNKILAEVVAAGNLLKWCREDRAYIGFEPIFNAVSGYREEIIEGYVDIIEII